jgi:hypothetical protein
MAQLATDNLALGTAHKKLTTKIAEINTFLQRHAMVGSLDTILQRLVISENNCGTGLAT